MVWDYRGPHHIWCELLQQVIELSNTNTLKHIVVSKFTQDDTITGKSLKYSVHFTYSEREYLEYLLEKLLHCHRRLVPKLNSAER